MEVDSGAESFGNSNSISDGGKFANLKAFVTAARDFKTSHSDTSLSLMNRYLGLISSSCDLSVFSPGCTEVCAFFSWLWRVMSDAAGPHWAGVSVLARAVVEPNAQYALTHTFKFLPVLSKLLSDHLTNEKKIKLLSVMQEISYGIKISWQESYLAPLIKQLTDWVVMTPTEPQHRSISQKSLTVLVNICYGNLPVVYTLTRTVNIKEFVTKLINMKDGGTGGVEVCRLLVCVSGTPKAKELHSYLTCALRALRAGIVEHDAMQLRHVFSFVHDVCSDDALRCHVTAYPHFVQAIGGVLTNIQELCVVASNDCSDSENFVTCLKIVLSFLSDVVDLDIYSLRDIHGSLINILVSGSRSCPAESWKLFATLLSLYKDEGHIPKELLSQVRDGLPALLVPPALDSGKTGLQWLQVVCVLSESSETQEIVFREVSPETLEDVLNSVLLYNSQCGSPGLQNSERAVLCACRAAAAAADRDEWRGAANRIAGGEQAKKVLNGCLSSSDPNKRKQVLQLIKHHYFPSELINQVFGEPVSTDSLSTNVPPNKDNMMCMEQNVPPGREALLDSLISRIGEALDNGQISDIATSSVMELYGYKISCLEQRLYSHTDALQAATEHSASLQHSLAMAQASNSQQLHLLYNTQMQYEKQKKAIEDLHKQLDNAESTLRGFRAKLAAERMERDRQMESMQSEFKQQLAAMENEVRGRERALEERLKDAETENNKLTKKLEQQKKKSIELAGVLEKFEERVEQRDKKLKEAGNIEQALRKDLELRENTIKQLEKTVLERENRLYQVTTQLEEMKRVQEMVAKLMSKNTNASVAGS